MKPIEQLKNEIEQFKTGIQLFDPDPEHDAPYFTIYKDGKLYGRSNRQAALDKFLINVKVAPENEKSGFTVVFDDAKDTVYEVRESGRLAGPRDFLDATYLMYIMRGKIV